MVRFAGYELEQSLGRGGMGEVWKARRGDEPAVALKILADPSDATASQRLLREGHLLTRLSHRNLVRVHEFGSAEGRVYVAMELLPGLTLARILEQGRAQARRATAAQVARTGGEIAAGLAAMHEAGVLHRDVKPSNVLVTEDRAVLVDFGIAREGAAPDITRPGAALGSLLYMSPEQLEGGPVDARSDVYQLGLMLWEHAAGERPFASLSPAEAVSRRLAHGVVPLPAPADAALARIVAACLERAAERRPAAATVCAQLEALQGIATAPAPAPAPAGQPERIGPYRILARLGAGGMGVVYRARKDGAPRDVAIKTMLPASGDVEPVIARFRREMRLARMVDHANVVRVLEDGQDGATLWFAMEHVEGRTLLQIQRAEGKVGVDEALAFVSDIVEGIGAMHARGVLHRDLKPANVMLDGAGTVRVMDLGMSKSEDVTQLTRTDELVGTPLYFPPEYADLRTFDERGDLYQIGLILHELVTGRRNFPKSDGERLSSPMQGGRPLPVPPEIEAAGAGVAAFYRKLLAPSPGQRFQTADEVASALRALPAGAVSCTATRKPAAALARGPATVSRGAPRRASGPATRPAVHPASAPADAPSRVAGAARATARLLNTGLLLAVLIAGLMVLANLPAFFHRHTAP